MRTKKMTVILLTLLLVSTMFVTVMAGTPEGLDLSTKHTGTVSWSNIKVNSGKRSVHLVANGTIGSEAIIEFPVPAGFTLADLESISWSYFLKEGYAPHVDVMVDTTGDGFIDDALVFEYAYNDFPDHAEGVWPQYECLMGDWYTTFSDDGDGPSSITNSSYAWPTTGPAGPFGTVCKPLSEWKDGVIYGSKEINSTTPIIELQFEVDNWLVTTEAYIDDIKLNGKVYDLELPPTPEPKPRRRGVVLYEGFDMGTMWMVPNKLIAIFTDDVPYETAYQVVITVGNVDGPTFEKTLYLNPSYDWVAIYLPGGLFPEDYIVTVQTELALLPYVVASSQYGVERDFDP